MSWVVGAPFRVGRLECRAVSDGTMALAPQDLFANALPGEAEAALEARGEDGARITLPFHCLLVRGPMGTVLIDSGVGMGLAPTLGWLQRSLKEVGVPPEAVDTVLLSHGHYDHCGGAVTPEGKRAFPRARILLRRAEFEFWMTEEALAQAGPRRGSATVRKLRALEPFLELLGSESEVLPGITAVSAPGHTPHNLVFRIESEGEALLYVADLVPHPLHLARPDWCLDADLDPAETVETKRQILRIAAEGGDLLYGYHLPLPAAGRVSSIGADRYRWEPVV